MALPKRLTGVHTKRGENIYKPDESEHLRLTHAWFAKLPRGDKRGPVLQAARMSKNGYAESEAPIFAPDLPSVAALAAMSLDELRTTFGPQHGWTDAWGLNGAMNWTESWTCFTFDAPDELRFVRVFA